MTTLITNLVAFVAAVLNGVVSLPAGLSSIVLA